jgi:MoaA/NifB/PqqE/SkfB family radical SAM enzyme
MSMSKSSPKKRQGTMAEPHAHSPISPPRLLDTRMKKLVFYGAGEYAMLTHKWTLARVAGREPVAFCDGDPHKQGKKFLGLPVMSFAEAKKRFGDLDVYVTANERNAPDIIGFLLETGVGPERILNYEPVEKRLGCSYLEALLLLQFNGSAVSVKICDCISEGGRARERPEFNIAPSEFTARTFGEAIGFMNGLADEIKDRRIPGCCAACPFIREQYFFRNRKKRHLILGGNVACNYKCLHCTNTVLFEKYRSSVYDDLNVAMDVIEESGVLHEFATIAFGVGEFTVNTRHKAFLRKIGQRPLMLFSNGYKYSEAVAEVLRQGLADICISIDAGTRATYMKIKGVDGFEQACENVRKYSECGRVVLKYIMYEGINVNEADIGNFYQLADDVADMVLLSRDFYAEGSLSDHTLKKSAEFIDRYRRAGKLSRVIGYQRADEKERLNKFLEECEK